MRELGPDVPLHFTAFHPAHKLLDRPVTPLQTLRLARQIAREEGLHHVYLGNVSDPEGVTTFCPGCHAGLIRRAGYAILEDRLSPTACCPHCGARIAGRFSGHAGTDIARRNPQPSGRDF